MIHGIYIQTIHNPEREKHVGWMIDTMDGMLGDLNKAGIPITPVYDETYNPDTPKKNVPRNGWIKLMKKALADFGDKAGGHILYCQDDLLFHEQFMDMAIKLTDLRPDRIFAFYNPTKNAFLNAFKKNHQCIAETTSGYWIQSMAFPIEHVRKLVEFNGYIIDEHRHDDTVVIGYTKIMKVPVLITVPALVQHHMWDKSSVGNPSKPGKNRPRYSRVYYEEFHFRLDEFKQYLQSPVKIAGDSFNYKNLLKP